MKAVVASPDAHGSLHIEEVDSPQPDSSEAPVRVRAFSLNRGEVRRAQSAERGSQIGWDTMGVIETPARDGSGPPAGTRVVGFSRAMRGWAEQVVLPSRALAAVPDAISDADAATLPVAALTALYALERCQVSVTGDWSDVADVAARLLDREYPGKPVLTIDAT